MSTQAKPTRFAFFALFLSALFIAALLFKGALITPPSAAETKAATGFDAKAAVVRLARILGDERPHPVDSPANDLTRERLLAEIKALGHSPEVRDDFACRGSKRWGGLSCARVRNVLFRIGPDGGNAVMVVSHYDSVPAGPGAGDDGIGVASTLEIAARLKGRTLSKPVIFLFTDGEEAGLLGAASFVRSDPWAKDVALAVNLEARGTGGPAIMFQTSSPNGREIAALTHSAPRTIANSMAADIYRTLPNDTDATEFLGKNYDVLNFAIIAPLARYHTPLDSLKYLELDSVGHMGGAALAAVEGHLAAGPKTQVEPHHIYSDIAGRFLLVLPQTLGLALLGFGFLAACLLYFRAGPGGAVRTLFAPPLAALSAAGLGYGALFLIKQVRSETQWWTATPMAAQLTFYAAATAGLILGLWLSKGVSRARVVASAWLWLTGLFLGISTVSPGAMILVAPAAGLFGLCVVASVLLKSPSQALARWLCLAPAALLLIMILPVLDFAEVGLGFGLGFGFGALAALVGFAAFAPIIAPDAGLGRVFLVLLLPVFAGMVWASRAPAYSPDVPRPLNLQHWHAEAANNWLLTPGLDPAPEEMNAVTAFKKAKVPGFDLERYAAPAPLAAEAPNAPKVEVLSDVAQGNKRALSLRISASDVDEVMINVSPQAGLTAVTSGSAASVKTIDLDAKATKNFRCVGRACATWDLQVVVSASKTPWTIRTVKRGLGLEADALLKARPATATPIQGGDVRVTAVSAPL